MGLFRRRQERGPVVEVYSGLRQQVLNLTPDQLGEKHAEEPILALVMETRYPEAVATLVGVAEGTTSLYFSSCHRRFASATLACVPAPMKPPPVHASERP